MRGPFAWWRCAVGCVAPSVHASSRASLSFRYQARLEDLYSALEERQKQRLRSLKEGTGGTVAERITQVCSSVAQVLPHAATRTEDAP